MEIGLSVNFGDDEYDFIPDESIDSSCPRCVFKGCPTKCSFLKESLQCGDKGYFVKHHPSAYGIFTSRIAPNDQYAEIKADDVKKVGGIGKRSYYSFPNGVEAEDICRYLPFNLGNVIKYACRAGRKDADKKVEDLRKAMDYLDNEIKRLEEGDA